MYWIKIPYNSMAKNYGLIESMSKKMRIWWEYRALGVVRLALFYKKIMEKEKTLFDILCH